MATLPLPIMASTPLQARAILLCGASYPRLLLPTLPSLRQQRWRWRLNASSSPPPPPHSRSQGGPTRRSASATFLALLLLPISPVAHTNRADAANFFDKYVKRKKLDPLEAYLPPVLLTQEQFMYLEKSLAVEQPEYDVSRSLLRSGPAGSLRVNIRAVAQYATDDGKGKAASDAVDQCLRALEDLDSLLLHASRKDPTASVESMKNKIHIALVALDSLLQTVPSPVLEKGKAMADAYRVPSNQNEDGRIEDFDPEMKELESLL